MNLSSIFTQVRQKQNEKLRKFKNIKACLHVEKAGEGSKRRDTFGSSGERGIKRDKQGSGSSSVSFYTFTRPLV